MTESAMGMRVAASISQPSTRGSWAAMRMNTNSLLVTSRTPLTARYGPADPASGPAGMP